MKFLCPSCKAKYQIADEKVIGRVVKMKCRQCGHIIEINEASTTGAGVSEVPGAPMDPSVFPPSVRPERPAPLAVGGVQNQSLSKAAPPKPARVPTPTLGSPAVKKPDETPKPEPVRPAHAAPRPATSAVGVSRSLGTVEPRPARATPGPESAVPRPGLERKGQPQASPSSERLKPLQPALTPERKSPAVATPASERKPQPTKSIAQRNPAKPERGTQTERGSEGRLPAKQEKTSSSLGVVTATSKPDPLAGAFAKAVENSPLHSGEHQLAGDEWYVGVGEQPIGPIRLAEIRDRASRGEIHLDCLVWRDGFEDWRPLTAFPELVAVVEEGVASARSLAPPAVGPSISPLTVPRQAPLTGVAAATIVETVAKKPEPLIEKPDDVVLAPKAARAFEEEPLEVAGISKQKIPLAAWFAVVMALVLGVTMGVVFIKPAPPQQIIKYVEVTAKPAQNSGNAPASVGSEQVTVGDIAPSEGNDVRAPSNAGARKVNSTTGTSTEVATASSAAPLQGLKGLSGLRGLGPQGGPQSAGASVSGGPSQLDAATLSKTVSRYTPSVKRSCWQPALDMRTPDAPTTARVTANISVGPNGRVQNVSTSGDPKGYRGLASCIQSRVRNWEFPPAGGTTEFNVPFVFAAQ